MKILLSAYACEPGKGSEPGIGWNWVRQIARFQEVWVVTRGNNRRPIESALVREPLPNAHFVYFDLPSWMRFWKRGQRGVHIYYYLWQVGAYFVARRLHRKIVFDLAHHITYGNYWMPILMGLLPVPLVWGPVGGGESAPRSFFPSFSLRGRVYETARDFARAMAQLDPFVRLTARRSVVALATSDQTENRLRVLRCRKISILSSVGLPTEEICRLASFPLRRSNPFRLISIGNLLHLKGFDLALQAFAQFHSRFHASEYWLIGDGPERGRLEKLARELKLTGKVNFLGSLPRLEVLEKLSECDVLVQSSLHDSGGWASLEAMAAGRPVICLDLGGPSLQVTEETGIKIPAISPNQVVTDLAAAMNQLASAPGLRARLGQAARERIQEHFNWGKKGEYLAKVYEQLIDDTANALTNDQAKSRAIVTV